MKPLSDVGVLGADELFGEVVSGHSRDEVEGHPDVTLVPSFPVADVGCVMSRRNRVDLASVVMVVHMGCDVVVNELGGVSDRGGRVEV